MEIARGWCLHFKIGTKLQKDEALLHLVAYWHLEFSNTEQLWSNILPEQVRDEQTLCVPWLPKNAKRNKCIEHSTDVEAIASRIVENNNKILFGILTDCHLWWRDDSNYTNCDSCQTNQCLCAVAIDVCWKFITMQSSISTGYYSYVQNGTFKVTFCFMWSPSLNPRWGRGENKWNQTMLEAL